MDTQSGSVADPAPPLRATTGLAKPNPADLVLIGALAVLFWPLFLKMYALWSEAEAPQSYAFLTLPAAVTLVWMSRDRLAPVSVRPAPVGLLLVLGGILLNALGSLAGAATISGAGFVLTVAGVIWARYGSAVMRVVWFPVAFLLTMVPLPSESLALVTFPLQRISIHLAAVILKPFEEVAVEGTRLHVGAYTLDVIAPCSGLTIVLPLVVLALFYMFIVAAPFWKKALLVLLTVPVAILVNALRVALIGAVGEACGRHAGEVFHDWSGIITVMIGFGVLYFLAKELKCHQISDDLVL